MRKIKKIGWIFIEILMILLAIFFNPLIDIYPYLKFIGFYKYIWMGYIIGWLLSIFFILVAVYIQFSIIKKERKI